MSGEVQASEDGKGEGPAPQSPRYQLVNVAVDGSSGGDGSFLKGLKAVNVEQASQYAKGEGPTSSFPHGSWEMFLVARILKHISKS
jgi:hypothetical protein